MKSHFDLTNHEFVNQFKSGNLEPVLFTHEAHLRIAWIYINQWGVEKATKMVCDQVRTFVIIADAEDKYNHTLTIAAVKIIHHFIQRSDSKTFSDFLVEFPRLNTNFKELVQAHYSAGTCFSEKAKREFVAPDLLGFD